MSSVGSQVRPVHWVARTIRSMRGDAPAVGARRWADAHLTAEERILFERMPNADQRHAIGVASAVDASLDHDDLGLDEGRRAAVIAAALLHDVGKTSAGLGTPGRAVATVTGVVAGDALAARWSDRVGLAGRLGRYLRYPEIGAMELDAVGSDAWVVAWACDHHRPEEEWSIPVTVGRVLVTADR